jgi:hypothetical protein
MSPVYLCGFEYSDDFLDTESSGHKTVRRGFAGKLIRVALDQLYLWIVHMDFSVLVLKPPNTMAHGQSDILLETTLFKRQGVGEKRYIESGDAPNPTLAGNFHEFVCLIDYLISPTRLCGSFRSCRLLPF